MRLALVFAALIALPTTCFAEPASDSSQAVQAAARHYRIQVYESFRSSRPQYDERRAVGDMLIGHWNSAGQPEAWNEELAQWFDEATAASRNNGPLPELPDLLPVTSERETSEPTVEDVQTFIPADEEPATTEAPAAVEVPQEVTPPATPTAAPAKEDSAKEGNVLESLGGAFWRAIAE